MVAATIFAVITLFPPAPGTAAQGSPPTQSATFQRTDPCLDQDASKRVKTYRQVISLGKVPLRCGQCVNGRGWGLRKLVAKARWNIWFDSMIGATLQSPKKVRHEGTAYVYRTRWFTECDPVYRFKVVVETRAKDGKKMGIVTAFQDFR